MSTLINIIILAAIPLIQATINDAWLYAPAGYLDSWYYFGFGLNYLDPTYLSDLYKASRLPWILVEFIARSLFSPVVASWLLQIGTLALGSSSLYLLFSRTLDQSSAFIAAAVFAAFPFAQASGGADYQNVLAGPLYALTWFLAIRSAQLGTSPRRLFWVGVTAALTLHSSVVFASLALVIGLHYIGTYRSAHMTWPSIAATVIPAMIGGVTITLILGLINMSVGRSFLFFSEQFDLAASFVLDTSRQKTWWHSWSTGWLWNAQYLGPLAAVFLIALINLIWSSVRKPKCDQVILYSMSFILAGALWIFWQAQGQTALDWYYFAYPLVFPFIGAVAATFALWASPLRPVNLLSRLIICAVLIGTLAAFDPMIQKLEFLPKLPFVEVTLLGLLYGAIVALPIFRPLRLWGGIAAISICIAFAMMGPSSYRPSTCSSRRAVERAMDIAHRLVRSEEQKQGLGFGRVFTWADKSETVTADGCIDQNLDLANFESSLDSTGFSYLEPPWGASTMEAISLQRLKEVASEQGLVVYVTGKADRVDQLMRRFVEVGGIVSAEQFHAIDVGVLRIPIYLFVVSKDKQS